MYKCVCYGKIHSFKTKKEAVKFWKECALYSEGSERERYISILMQLDEGRKECNGDN